MAAQVEGRAEPHRDGPHAGELRADRLDLLRADEADRHDGGAGLEGEPRHARAAAVQAAVERAGALGVERERRAGLEDAPALVERLLRLRARAPVDADGADAP